MSIDWISTSIRCQEELVCAAISANEPLLPLRDQITFRAILLFTVWEDRLCEGRLMSLDDFYRMEDFEDRFSDESLDENGIREVIEEFGDFIPKFLTPGTSSKPGTLHVSQRLFTQAKQDPNNPMRGGDDAPRLDSLSRLRQFSLKTLLVAVALTAVAIVIGRVAYTHMMR